MIIDPEARQYAAALLRRHFEGTCTLDVLVEALENSADPLIQAAVDIAVQQPERGFLGVTERHWHGVYWPRVLYVLQQLEAGDTGAIPPAPLYPAATPLRVLGLLVFAVFLFYVSVKGWLDLMQYILGVTQPSRWEVVDDLISAGFFGFIFLRIIGGLRYRFWLYRQWRGTPPIKLPRPAQDPRST